MNSPDEDIFPYRPARSYSVRSLETPVVFMYHGSLVERNGLELAVEGLARIHKLIPTAELRICGRSTPYLELVMDKARTLGVDRSIRYLGSKKLEDLVPEIEACDVGIIPNQRNTFTEINTPTRIFEYLALGKPVIAPSTLGILDYFAHGSLLFFEPGNAESLANQMAYASAHPVEAVRIAEAGQQVYLAHAWEQEREILLGLVAGLLKAGKAA
jgi:glycosyltransferase involved in cell wall biosynthesis